MFLSDRTPSGGRFLFSPRRSARSDEDTWTQRGFDFSALGCLRSQHPGAWQDAEAIKQGVTPNSDEFIDCLGEAAHYIHDTYGEFPNTFTTMMLTGYVPTVPLYSDSYDAHYQAGAYLPRTGPTSAHRRRRTVRLAISGHRSQSLRDRAGTSGHQLALVVD